MTASDFYQRLRRRITTWNARRPRSRWTEYVLLAPDLFHLLVRMAADPEVPLATRGWIVALVAYFVAPVDVIPEGVVGPMGYIDDVAITAYVLDDVMNRDARIEPIVRRHWAGSGDVLETLRRVLDGAARLLDVGLWARLTRRFARGDGGR